MGLVAAWPQESEKEVGVVQDALRAAQAEAAQTRDALAASAAKQREGEGLLADFTQASKPRSCT